MPTFDEFNRKRGIQYCLEASKEATRESEINSLLLEKEVMLENSAMAAFDELNQKKGISPSYLE